MEPVPLSRLVHDVAQDAYKDLHATMDTLGDADDAARRAKLLDFAVRTRHRITRLLVAVRWFMDYSAFHQSATVARDASAARSAAAVHAADSLWASAHAARAAAAQPPALAPAAEILPKIIEAVVGLDLDEFSAVHAEAPAIFRLGAVTRNRIRGNLPDGVAVLSWRVPPEDTAVRIGVAGVWSADIVLDRLPSPNAFLRILRLAVHVAADVDAGSPMRRRFRASIDQQQSQLKPAARQGRILFSREQEEPLRQMVEDRMHWSSDALAELSNIMSREISAEFAMDHVRAQASALSTHPAWRLCGLRVEGISATAPPNSPIVIRYWLQSYRPSSITVSPSFPHAMHTILTVSHEPPVLGVTMPSLHLAAIDIETLVLETCRERARKLLSQVPALNERNCAPASSPGRQSIHLALSNNSGIEVAVILNTGAWRLCTYGSALLATGGVPGWSALKSATTAINGSNRGRAGAAIKVAPRPEGRFFASVELLNIAVVEALEHVTTAMPAAFLTRNANACDLSGLLVYPPGPLAVQEPPLFKPLLVPVEADNPVSFATMSSFDNNLDVVALKDSTEIPDQLVLVQNKRRRVCATMTAFQDDASMIGFGNSTSGVIRLDIGAIHSDSAEGIATVACVLTDTSTRMRRDRLVKALVLQDVIEDADDEMLCPFRTQLQMKADPLPLESAELILSGIDDGWQIQLTLLTDIMDDSGGVSGVVLYSSSSKTLSFRYPEISDALIKEFVKDLMRSRTAALLSIGLQDAGVHIIERRAPSHVQLIVGSGGGGIGAKVRVVAEYCQSGFHVTFLPDTSRFLSCHLAPLVEEMLNATGEQAGYVLSGLLETSVPLAVAIEQALPTDKAYWRIRFSMCMRARLVLLGGQRKATYAVDIDGRSGGGKVMLVDFARVVAAAPSASAVQQNGHKPMPRWDEIVERLSCDHGAKLMHGAAAILFPMAALPATMRAVVKAVRSSE
jgi:Mediator complex subunit MED14